MFDPCCLISDPQAGVLTFPLGSPSSFSAWKMPFSVFPEPNVRVMLHTHTHTHTYTYTHTHTHTHTKPPLHNLEFGAGLGHCGISGDLTVCLSALAECASSMDTDTLL